MPRGEMRRILVAFGLFRTSEMATWIALLVWAFDRGGTAATSIIAVGQLVPATIAAPLGSVLTDRMPRLRALRLGYLLQAVMSLGTAAALYAEASFWLVTVAAAFLAVSMTLTRPVHHALVPELSRSPEELTAGNAASTAVEGLADFAGPALAALLLLFLSAGSLFVVMGAVSLVSALLTRGADVVQTAAIREPTPYLREAAEGFRVVIRDPAAAALTAIVGAQFVVVGLLDILAVVLAISVLGTGPSGPGIITSAIGVGALIGGASAMTMTGLRRFGPALAAGMLVTSLAVAFAAASWSLVLAVVLFALAGSGRAMVDVAARTLLQRSMSAQLLAKILGVQESLLMGGTALGAALAPLLVLIAGPRGAFLVTAVVLPTIGLVCWVQIRRLDAAAPSTETIEHLRSVSMFSYLPAPQLEQLAAALRLLPPLRDGEVLIRQGDPGHECYVVRSGTLAIERDGVVLAELGPSSVVGEIALLRDVPRTATARAIGTVELAALDREPFLLAVTGSARAYQAVDEAVRGRLDRHEPRPDEAGPQA
jgi:MFS family permease